MLKGPSPSRQHTFNLILFSHKLLLTRGNVPFAQTFPFILFPGIVIGMAVFSVAFIAASVFVCVGVSQKKKYCLIPWLVMSVRKKSQLPVLQLNCSDAAILVGCNHSFRISQVVKHIFAISDDFCCPAHDSPRWCHHR